jgi:hypothetical protein
MTLLLRLTILGVIGALAALATAHYLWPAKPFGGYFVAASARGTYALHIESGAAQMQFVDKKKKTYTYRGKIAKEGDAVVITWIDQKVAGEWEPMHKQLLDPVTIESRDRIVAPEGVFERKTDTADR